MRRRALIVAVSVSALVLPAGLAGAAPDDRASRGGTPPAAGGVPEGDRDGDHVSDDFEDELRGADAAAEVQVIVTGFGSDRGRAAVGAFQLRHELELVNGFAATMTAAQARALARHPLVDRVEKDGVVHLLDDATDRDFGASAARAAEPGLDGSGVGICVIDTGIDPNHEQIAPRTVAFKDYVNGRTAAYDDHGHGTHVAAIAAGDGAGGTSAATFGGVAPAADLYAAKVLNSSGSGSDSNVAASVQWCHEQPGVDVLSLSLGSDGTDGSDAVSKAVDAAVAGGDVVVVAAGNSGDGPGTISAPGVAAGAITVGAVSDHSAPPGTARHDDGIWLAAFSSRGPTIAGLTKPDIAAPGVSVTAADAGTTAGYVTMSGTSMATPYVSGAVALALDAAAGLPTAVTPADIKSALMASAVDVGKPGKDDEWGAGLIDVRAFVDRFTTSDLGQTSFPAHQRVTGVVENNGAATIPITIEESDLGVPIAVTLTADGSLACASYFFGLCLGWEWTPDLDLTLTAPNGVEVARSECPLAGLSCGVGRQETIGIVPALVGTYTLRVFAFTGEPNYGKGGSFAADIFHGPLGGTTTEPPPPPPGNQPPVADAGTDRTVKIPKKSTSATFTLDGTGSVDSDGTVVSYAWTDVQAGTGATGPRPSFTKSEGSYTFRLVVTDDDGAASAPDEVVVTVVAATGKPQRP
jgi:serine protease AprX